MTPDNAIRISGVTKRYSRFRENDEMQERRPRRDGGPGQRYSRFRDDDERIGGP
jgi:hypothetical protein